MSDEQPILEENVARLVRAGLGAEVRPDPLVREQMEQLLLAQLRARPAPAPFPDRVVALLAGVLALMAAWLVVQVVGPVARPAIMLPFLVVAGLLACNLALVPAASVVIVLRRRQIHSM